MQKIQAKIAHLKHRASLPETRSARPFGVFARDIEWCLLVLFEWMGEYRERLDVWINERQKLLSKPIRQFNQRILVLLSSEFTDSRAVKLDKGQHGSNY